LGKRDIEIRTEIINEKNANDGSDRTAPALTAHVRQSHYACREARPIAEVDSSALTGAAAIGAMDTSANTTVASAVWSDSGRHYTVAIAKGRQAEFDVVISCVGSLNILLIPPDIDMDAFPGIAVHTSRWRDDISLEGKRVGVIGTGASAVQIVAEAAKSARSVTIFQRSPTWVIPKKNRVFTTRQRARYGKTWQYRYKFFKEFARYDRLKIFGRPDRHSGDRVSRCRLPAAVEGQRPERSRSARRVEWRAGGISRILRTRLPELLHNQRPQQCFRSPGIHARMPGAVCGRVYCRHGAKRRIGSRSQAGGIRPVQHVDSGVARSFDLQHGQKLLRVALGPDRHAMAVLGYALLVDDQDCTPLIDNHLLAGGLRMATFVTTSIATALFEAITGVTGFVGLMALAAVSSRLQNALASNNPP
jgi:hypothetical protein